MNVIVPYNKQPIRTLRFDDFDEAFAHLVVGDSVLVMVSGITYFMKVYSIRCDYILCNDDVEIIEFHREDEFDTDALQRVLD